MMEATNPYIEQEQRADNFSPKKLVLQVRSLVRYILRKWWIILLIACGCGILGVIYSMSKKDLYQAEITFALDEEATQNAQNAFVQSGEELGLGPLSIDASGALFARMTNIAELMKSRLLIEKVLRSDAGMNRKKLLFANFFLDSLDYRDKWMKDPAYEHLAFNSGKDSLIENAVIANMYETIVSKYLKVDRKGKETTIISVSCNSENESFSKYFLEALVKEVTNYYTDIKTQRAKMNMVFIENRMDSIKNVYYDAIFGKASFTDAHTNPSRQVAVISSEKQQTDIQILKAAYIDLARSLEIAKVAVVRVTPLIQYLDEPLLPLKKTSSGKLKWFLAFFFIGTFLTIAWFTFKKIIQAILTS